MFSKNSRYRRLPDIVTTDPQGRPAASKVLRLPPQVEGVFHHTIEDADRLDHLAFKYYQQPNKWWRISDANPDFLSPQALLGKEMMVTYRFPLRPTGDEAVPPLSTLIRALMGLIGVEDVKIVEQSRLETEVKSHNGQPVTVQVERIEQAAIVVFNRLNATPGSVVDHITQVGFTVGSPERIGRVGKQITIPPNIVG